MRRALPSRLLRRRVNAAPLASAARRLHVPSEAAFAVLRANTDGTTRHEAGSESERDSIRVSIVASRAMHAPVLRLERAGEASRSLELPLSIISLALPTAVKQWLADGKRERSETLAALEGMWKSWRDSDWLRLHATVGGHEGRIAISDLQVVADDFGVYRQDALREVAHKADRHPLEKKASLAGLFYHKRKGEAGGNIGSYGYGAGVAMSTMDALTAAGGRPANFLDGGGGATEKNVRAALDVLMSDPDVKVVFVNSFGGITKTDMIAQGIVDVLRETVRSGEPYPPFVVRLRGTGESKARSILEGAADLENIHVERDLNKAAQLAVDLAKGEAGELIPSPEQPVQVLSPVVFTKDGQYESTRENLRLEQDAKVLVMGTGKASLFHNSIAQDFGTNIVGACAPKKEGTTFLGRPVYDTVGKATSVLQPQVASVFVPFTAAADAIIECIEAEIPLVVSYAEGIPQKDQLRVQAALRSQSKTRLMGANCPGMIIPGAKVKLGIQPLAVHKPGCVGLASRSGTISYELAAQTTQLGLGQSAVYGLGGDPFPGTRTWEVLDLMLRDDNTKVICLVGEVGGQMEEETAEVYRDYRARLSPGETAKPVIGFIAGASTSRGLVYGHAGAVWWTDAESAESKNKCWRDAGIIVAPTLGEVGTFIKAEAERLGIM